jgi:putative acetyltransferase
VTIEVATETDADVAAIRAVTVAAFLRARHTSHTEQLIVDALRKAGQLTVSLVAKIDGAIVGHVAVSPVAVSDGARGWYGLGPLSVVPECQGRGVGSRLMREALRALERHGASGCVLLGDPGYYQRFGFRADPKLELPGVPAEYFQALSFGGALPRGTVSYHAAFQASLT